jgi:hypothetical protein
MTLSELASALRESRGFRHKTDIGPVVAALSRTLPGGMQDMTQAVAVGDDCAAIADGDGYLLLAVEGLVSDFIRNMPWFAGYSSVMVNVSDVYAMGGRPLAVVDALWSNGMSEADQVLQGMAAASSRYGVPIVGGHTNNRSEQGQLAVAILGRARRLLSSFNARPGDKLVMAIDLRGGFEEPYPFWNASVPAPASRLRADLELLPELAETGLCDAAKDISMAGALGTAMMLLECSQAGAVIDLERIPAPPGVPELRWLTAFPSFGFVLSVRPQQADAVCERFLARDIACAVVGTVNDSRRVTLSRGEEHALLWDFADQAFIAPPTAREDGHV